MTNKLIDQNIIRRLPVSDAVAMLAQAVNELAAMIQTGPVWENRVAAQRDAENIVASLPAGVQAAMIEEEAQKALEEKKGAANENHIS